jgi:hypothetical protein
MEKKENRWINVHDDKVMLQHGLIRYGVLAPRDPSVWSKTKNEKRILRNEKLRYKERDGHFHSIPESRATYEAKLIVYLVNNNKFPHSTYSKNVLNTKVNDVLENYTIKTKAGVKSLVSKYCYNGKTYNV